VEGNFVHGFLRAFHGGVGTHYASGITKVGGFDDDVVVVVCFYIRGNFSDSLTYDFFINSSRGNQIKGGRKKTVCFN
jgi:hypothetical protein